MKNFHDYKKFFDVKGVTSTSANYLSNIAKEIIKSYVIFEKISFETTTVRDFHAEDGKVFLVGQGISEQEFNDLNQLLENKAKLNSLIAWFREAIKAREFQMEEIESMSFESWMKDMKNIDDLNFGYEIPEYKAEDYEHITKEEYIENNFSVKEMNRYFYLQSMSSSLGKFIHPNGAYAAAKEIIEKSKGTSYVKETPSANMLYSISSSVSIEKIQAKFFELQDKQREYQKQLNEILFSVEKAVNKYNDDQDAKLHQFNLDKQDIQGKIRAEELKYKKEFSQWKVDELNRLRSLKIIIPNDLMDIYQFVTSYGKQSGE